MSHENITFNDNGTLSTIPHHPLEWREELSNGRSEDDVFYLPNIALLVSPKSDAEIYRSQMYFISEK
jgi:scavenger receptor class B, member 1